MITFNFAERPPLGGTRSESRSSGHSARRRLAASFVLLVMIFGAISARADTYSFSKVAGSPTAYGSVDGTGSAARFGYWNFGLATDTYGNTYIADYANYTVRKVTTAGVVTTLAGLAGNPGIVDGTGSAARFQGPSGIAVDIAGNVYVGDGWGRRVRKITPGGVVTTLAGPGPWNYVDGQGANGSLSDVRGLAVAGDGTVFACDVGANTIRKITSSGYVSTFAGPGASAAQGTTDGTGTAALFNAPRGIAIDGNNNLYVADSNNHTIRKITPTGVVTTLAGLGGASGSVNGTGSAARFYIPFSVSSDAGGNIVVADTYNSTIRAITGTGVVTTVGGIPSVSGGYAEGVGSNARFSNPMGVFRSNANVLYISDTNNFVFRRGDIVGATDAPTITSPLTANGPVNTPFTYQITATNSPTSYTSSALPAGLSLNSSTGLISGTPTAAGSTTVLLSALKTGFSTGIATLTITIMGPPPVITSPTTVTVILGGILTYQITATNSPTTFNFSNLPPGTGGYSTTSGLLTQSTTAPGDYNMLVSASNAGGGTGQATVTVKVKVPPPTITLIEPVGATTP
jgi:hypothetical protein